MRQQQMDGQEQYKQSQHARVTRKGEGGSDGELLQVSPQCDVFAGPVASPLLSQS